MRLTSSSPVSAGCTCQSVRVDIAACHVKVESALRAVLCDADLNEHMIQQIWWTHAVRLRDCEEFLAPCVRSSVAHLVEAVGQRSKALHVS